MHVAAPGRRSTPAGPGRAASAGWPETLLGGLAASLALWVMVQPAFRTYFFGENFLYLGQYLAHDRNFWSAALGPSDAVFFRPLFFVASLPWYAILPQDPWAYHLRNFGFDVLNLLLLHRVLLRLVATRGARLTALFLFAVSKVHLTIVGYLNIFDSTVTLLVALLTVLCALRYVAARRRADYWATLGFSFLAMFTKDYGIVVVGLVATVLGCGALNAADGRGRGRGWLRDLAPLVPLGLVYLALRHTAVGLLPQATSAYAPQLAPEQVARKLLAFATTLPNLSVIDAATTGAAGLGALVGPTIPLLGVNRPLLEYALGVAFLALVAGTWARARPKGWWLLLPVVWMAAYFGPTLIVRNSQIYYMYEAMAGAAVLVGMCLDGPDRGLRRAWVLAVVVIAMNGLASNYRGVYAWQRVANAVEDAAKPLVAARAGQPLESATFATADPAFWRFALTADGKGPLLPFLLRQPLLQVRVVDYAGLAAVPPLADARHLVIDLDRDVVPTLPWRGLE